MLDVITLQERGRYVHDSYLQAAAHERLLSQIRRPLDAVPSRARRRARLGSLAVAVLALLLVLVGLSVDAAPAPPDATSMVAELLVSIDGSGCWVSGDLVGDANPAVIATALCGY